MKNAKPESAFLGIDPDGIPVIRRERQEKQKSKCWCTICGAKTAEVSAMARGGLHVNCRNCGYKAFLYETGMSIELFRLWQRVYRDDANRNAILAMLGSVSDEANGQ